MATSSLTHNFVISDPDAVERFVAALEASEPFRTPIRAAKINEVTDPEQIYTILNKIAKYQEENNG